MAVKEAVGAAMAVPKKTMVGFWRGLTYPFKGARFVFFKHPELVKYWIVPICLTLIALVLVFRGAWEWRDDVVGWIWSEPTGDDFWAGVARFFHGLVEIVAAVAMMLLGIVVVYLVTAPLAAPFKAALSDKVDEIVSGVPSPKVTVKDLAIDVFRTVSYEIGYFVITLVLWIASLLLPVVGQIIVSVITFVITALYFGVDYIDWPASRRGHGLIHRFGLAWRHFLPMMGYGTGVWLFMLIPFVNLFFMPAAVAGGTLLYIDLEKEQADKKAAAAKVNAPTGVASNAA